ncbi:MAG: DNA-deoxyinosine glycosylase [Woeseia sp.]
MPTSRGFPPIAAPDARVLILGSLPSRKSIEAREYYAHPRNAFWQIMGELFAAGRDTPYASRADTLKANRIAVWDVLAQSVRSGSMDSDIEVRTAKANDFVSFLHAYRGIRLICFNGQKAARMFDDLVLSGRPDLPAGLRYETLPSTSPAYASMAFDDKLRKWSIVVAGAQRRTT